VLKDRPAWGGSGPGGVEQHKNKKKKNEFDGEAARGCGPEWAGFRPAMTHLAEGGVVGSICSRRGSVPENVSRSTGYTPGVFLFSVTGGPGNQTSERLGTRYGRRVRGCPAKKTGKKRRASGCRSCNGILGNSRRKGAGNKNRRVSPPGRGGISKTSAGEIHGKRPERAMKPLKVHLRPMLAMGATGSCSKKRKGGRETPQEAGGMVATKTPSAEEG